MGKVKPRIVLVGPTAKYFKGGIVHYTANLFAEFKKQGYPVKLVGFSRGYPKHFYPGLIDKHHPGGDMELLDWLKPWSWYKTAKTIAKFKPQIVVWQWWTWFWTLPFFITIWILKKLCRTKIVIIAHNPFDHEQALYKKWGSHLVLSQANTILVPSSKMRKDLKSIFPNKTVDIAFHPLYWFFKTRNPNQQQSQKKLKLNSPLLLFFGHVRRYKGLAVLLGALDYLWTRGKKINLLIVGEFWEDKEQYLKLVKSKYRKLVSVIDRYVADEEVQTYFAACDAVVVPYLSGSGSGPAKIALAFGKPLVATSVADNPDLFSIAKVGVMVKPGSKEDLAKAIALVLKNKNQYKREIKKVQLVLSWQNLVAKIVRL